MFGSMILSLFVDAIFICCSIAKRFVSIPFNKADSLPIFLTL